MTTHHERVRAVRLVAGLESSRRTGAGEAAVSTDDHRQLVARTHARLERLRVTATGADRVDQLAWKLAVYDAALAEMSDGLGLPHALDDVAVFPEDERARVGRALLDALRRNESSPDHPADVDTGRSMGWAS